MDNTLNLPRGTAKAFQQFAKDYEATKPLAKEPIDVGFEWWNVRPHSIKQANQFDWQLDLTDGVN